MAGTTSADALLSVYPDHVQRLAHQARDCITRWLPDVSEKIDVPSRLIAYAHGPGYKGAVCTLILSKTGISSAWSEARPSLTPTVSSRGVARCTGTYSCPSRQTCISLGSRNSCMNRAPPVASDLASRATGPRPEPDRSSRCSPLQVTVSGVARGRDRAGARGCCDREHGLSVSGGDKFDSCGG